jgi:hypothetical protein
MFLPYTSHSLCSLTVPSLRQTYRLHEVSNTCLELELGKILTQMTQKPMLRVEGECACVAQMARAKIRGRDWVVKTLGKREELL